MPRNCTVCAAGIFAPQSTVLCTSCTITFHGDCVQISACDLSRDRGWLCALCTSKGRSLRSQSANLRTTLPLSPLEKTSSAVRHPDSDPNTQTVTLAHSDTLMERIQEMSASITRVKERQNDISTELAECSTSIKEHSETLLTRQSASVACETTLPNSQRSHSNLTVEVTEISTRVTTLESIATNIKPTDSSSNLNYSEILERISKAHNLILSNLPESPDDASDKTTVARLIDHISPNSSPHISCCI
ncbi:hypothetical protein HHI36_014422 [Cryptolaemus montrouzieri]|uniref:PHD-type domain-containing protein n=1 Tax=Cryptolaemus montrouzieri TaxID=559131 RepID=A0ABD2N2S4_9CUCU